jgi:hypothetical protein
MTTCAGPDPSGSSRSRRSLCVSKQRAHQIAEEKGFPLRLPRTPVAECGPGTRCRHGRSVGEARNPGASRRSAIEIQAAAIPRSGPR